MLLSSGTVPLLRSSNGCREVCVETTTEGRVLVEGYTARDALILMRLDLTEQLHEIQRDISELSDTLEFAGIAEQLLREDDSAAAYAAIKRWLEIVSNRTELERDLDELLAERDELVGALEHLDERLTGRRIT